MNNIIDYTRNWGQSVVKWSLAVDQNMGPHNGGCGTCTGLITVHNGDARTGQVDYTVEYYDMGQLTKFVKPGAYRIDSTANCDGAERRLEEPGRLEGADRLQQQRHRTRACGELGQRVIHLHAARQQRRRRSPGAARQGTGGGTGTTGPITGLGGKCVDVAGANSANGTAVQLYDCNGSARAAVDRRHRRHDPRAGQVPGRGRTVHGGRCEAAAVGLQRHGQPAVGATAANELVSRRRASVWTRPATPAPTAPGCRSGTAPARANQKWTVPA